MRAQASERRALKVLAGNNELIGKFESALEAKGGFEKVYEYDLWGELDFSAQGLKNEQNFEFFQRHILARLLKARLKKFNVETFDPESLQRPVFIELHEGLDYDSMLRRPESVLVLRNCMTKWGLDESIFEPKNIGLRHGDFRIRVMFQNPLSNSFKVNSQEMFQKSTYSTVAEYIKYQKTLEKVTIRGALPSEVKFAVNVDIGTWEEMTTELEAKIPSVLMCKGSRDMLRLLRQEIEGITIPQIYLKVAGCWTGGHEENLRIRAINLNTGKGDVEWYCMEVSETARLRTMIQAKHGIDIYYAEGLWYTDLFFCLQNGFKVTKFVQRPGDTVILKPGTLHWVRSLENTTNVAWNIALNDHFEILQIYDRYKENIAIKFKNLFPVKTLFLDLLNCHRESLHRESLDFVQGLVGTWCEEEHATFASVSASVALPKIQQDLVNVNNVLFCSFCNNDTLIYWATCFTEENYEIFCLKCFEDHCRKHSRCPSTHQVFRKASKKLTDRFSSTDLETIESFKPIVASLVAYKFYVGKQLAMNIKSAIRKGKGRSLEQSEHLSEDDSSEEADHSHEELKEKNKGKNKKGPKQKGKEDFKKIDEEINNIENKTDCKEASKEDTKEDILRENKGKGIVIEENKEETKGETERSELSYRIEGKPKRGILRSGIQSLGGGGKMRGADEGLWKREDPEGGQGAIGPGSFASKTAKEMKMSTYNTQRILDVGERDDFTPAEILEGITISKKAAFPNVFQAENEPELSKGSTEISTHISETGQKPEHSNGKNTEAMKPEISARELEIFRSTVADMRENFAISAIKFINDCRESEVDFEAVQGETELVRSRLSELLTPDFDYYFLTDPEKDLSNLLGREGLNSHGAALLLFFAARLFAKGEAQKFREIVEKSQRSVTMPDPEDPKTERNLMKIVLQTILIDATSS